MNTKLCIIKKASFIAVLLCGVFTAVFAGGAAETPAKPVQNKKTVEIRICTAEEATAVYESIHKETAAISGLQFVPKYGAFSSSDRQTYGMDSSVPGILCNADIFAAQSVALPQTFRELEQACAAFNRNGITPFAADFQTDHTAADFFMYALSAFQNEPPDSQCVHALYIIDFVCANTDGNREHTKVSEAFASGHTAMLLARLSDFRALQPSANMLFIPFPFTNTRKYSTHTVPVSFSFTETPDVAVAAVLQQVLDNMTLKPAAVHDTLQANLMQYMAKDIPAAAVIQTLAPGTDL